MQQGRDNWTDPRIDDLDDRVKDVAGRMDAGFARMDARMDASLARMDAGFAEMNARMDAGFAQTNARMDAGFGQVNGRVDAFQRTMMQIGGGVITALIALIATQL